MERILEEEGFNPRALTQERSGYEAGLDVCDKTIKRPMGTMDYHKCLACRKESFTEKTKAERVEICEIWKERSPKKEDRYSIRFSDKCRYGSGLHTRRRSSRQRHQNRRTETTAYMG